MTALLLLDRQCETANAAAKAIQVEYWPNSEPADGLPQPDKASDQETAQEFLESLDEEQTEALIGLVGIEAYEHMAVTVEDDGWTL